MTRHLRDGLALAALAVTAHGLVRMARFASPRHAPPRALAAGPYDVTAVVPARDEERAIGRCVEALLAAGVREVVVADDGSCDGTRDAAARARIVASPRPGKPSACAAGAAATQSAWLWFVDADVTVAPHALARLLACDTPFVSALGRLVGEPWLMPEVGLGLARRLDLDAVADPVSPDAFAAGPCLLVRRDVYERIGGHAAVRHEVVEDVALARVAKAHGVPVRVVLAPDLLEVRTYASVAATWQGLLRSSATVRPSLAREALEAYAVLAPLLLARRSRVAALALGLRVLASAGGRLVARVPVAPALAAPVADLALVANAVASRRVPAVRWRGRDVTPA